MDTELWKSIPSYEGHYEVSNFGRVRSCTKTIRCAGGKTRVTKGKIVQFSNNPCGYLYVSLWRDNRARSFRVNRLVAEVFLPNPENKKTVNHKDGNKHDNAASNLEWFTRSEQMRHSVDVLGNQRGSKAYQAKLVESDIPVILGLVREGITQQEIARRYGMSQGSIGEICRGETWKHVPR